MRTSWGMGLVEVQESLKEDSSVPIGGSCDSPSGLFHLHTISSFFLSPFSPSLLLSQSNFFLCSLFSPFQFIHCPYSPSVSPNAFPPVFSLNIHFFLLSTFWVCYPPSPSILSQVSPSFISLPCLAYLPRACIVSVSITDSVAVPHRPGHWDLQWCPYSFQFSNQGVILQLVNGQQ